MVGVMYSLFLILTLFSVADSCLGPNFGRKLLESPKLYNSPCEALEIVTRDAWSDRKPAAKSSISGPVSHVFIHHTVTEQCFGEKWCTQTLKGIQKYHVENRGYKDIGYSFLVGGDGIVYEGRGWNTVGAHTVGYNSQSYAISFLGNFMDDLPDKLALKAAKRLIACGQERNKITSSYALHGHRDVATTACPGDKLYQHISSWPAFDNMKKTDDDEECTQVHGVCQSTDKSCSGQYEAGLCTGDSNRRCCIPQKSNELTTPTTTHKTTVTQSSSQEISELQMTQAELDKLRKQLEVDEGVKYEIYVDSVGELTFGIGHLIIDGDPEYGLPEGTVVSRYRVEEAFNDDIQKVLKDVFRWSNDCNQWPAEVKQIISNMMFNLGLTRLNKFKRLKSAVQRRDWQAAADEMADSKWADQVKGRAVRLIERMRNVTG